jgi:uncharacterized membrane protein YhaH (DUF805 family)
MNMDTIKSLYLTTDGRISRKTWWLAAIGLAVVNLLISMVVFPIAGLGMPNAAQLAATAEDPAALSALISGAVQAASWANLVLFAIFAYPIYAISVKRRHDKDNNGLDVTIYLVLTALLLFVQALGLGYTTAEIGGMTIPVPTMLSNILGIVVGIAALYMLVVLGFLKGTEGPNQYGPDPLGATAAAAA